MVCCLNPDCPNPANPEDQKLCLACGTPLVPLLRNRFRVIRLLSDEGGFGRTYLSEDVDKLNERCVVKQLAPKFQGTWSQKKAVELFSQEAQRLQELGEHPQIPTLLAYFEQDNCLYLVQQFVNGQNLLKELQRRKIYQPEEVREILLHLLPVLKFIHDRGVIHRDIKPENIIRRYGDGRLSLIDFGSSKHLTGRVKHKVGTSIGSHGYSPLEQIRDGKAYPASDLFGLGATCFHLLTGISPFQLWMEYGYGWVTNWRQYLRSPLPTDLDYVLDRLLRKDIQERYQSVEQVMEGLKTKQVMAPPVDGLEGSKITSLSGTRFTSVQYGVIKGLVVVGAVVLLVSNHTLLYEKLYEKYLSLHSFLASMLSDYNYRPGKLGVDEKAVDLSLGISLVQEFSGNQHLVSCLTISPDGKMLVSSSDRTVRVSKLSTSEEIITFSAHFQNVNTLAITPDGYYLLSGSDDHTIKLWNLRTGELIRTFRGHSDSIQALIVSSDGQTLVSASNDYTVKVWDISTGGIKQTFRGHTSWVRALAMSSDGLNITSANFDSEIKVWDVTRGAIIHTLGEPSEPVTAIAFSPDRTILVSGNGLGMIKVWNLATGQEITTIAAHKDTITALAISNDGKTLVSGGADNHLKIWRFSPGARLNLSPEG